MTATRRDMLPGGGRRPRVVIDTNVVLSALVFRKGATAQMREAWQAGRCVPLVGTASVRELVRVLAYPKFGLDAIEQHELLGDYLPFAATVRVPVPAPAVPACRDPLEVPFLHLAVAGKADALVTGDADLLAMARLGRCPIMTPVAFLACGLMTSVTPP